MNPSVKGLLHRRQNESFPLWVTAGGWHHDVRGNSRVRRGVSDLGMGSVTRLSAHCRPEWRDRVVWLSLVDATTGTHVWCPSQWKVVLRQAGGTRIPGRSTPDRTYRVSSSTGVRSSADRATLASESPVNHRDDTTVYI
jgi:hypothetical protein